MLKKIMLLKNIVDSINLESSEVIVNNSANQVNSIVLSSLEADQNTIFTAIKGFKTNGHSYLNDAYNRGCRNFIIEDTDFINNDIKNNSTIIKVNNSRKALALVSNFLAGYPANQLKMLGITGTKGKTTVTTLLYQILKNKYNSSMFSTIKYIINNQEIPSERTTMEAHQLQKLLKQSLNNNDQLAVVEVSSHAVTLNRIEDINWDIGIFTSFSRDHLDLYGTMEKYFDAKLDFFRNLNKSNKSNKLAIINIDDPKGNDICKTLDSSVKIVKVGKDKKADYQICNSQPAGSKAEIKINNKKNNFIIETYLKGNFNITNVTLAVACALELGIELNQIQKVLDEIKGIEGRFEIVIENPYKVIVDYAHTPESLMNILKEARKLTTNKIILVFGCTGDRDKQKRSIMGNIAADYADYSIITNDDTYTESPQEIAKQLEKGFIEKNKHLNQNYEIILDRKSAICKAMKKANQNDVVLLAGMGHEKVQILNQGPVAHNDKEEALKAVRSLSLNF